MGVVAVAVVALAVPRSAPAATATRTVLTAPPGITLTALHADRDGIYVGGVARPTDGSRRGFLRRLSADGKVSQTIWDGDGLPFLIRSGTDSVVFATRSSNGGPEVLRRWQKQDGRTRELAAFGGHSNLRSIAIAGSSIYYASGINNTSTGQGEIGVISADGERQPLVRDVAVGPVVLSEQSIHWISSYHLHRLAMTGADPGIIATFDHASAEFVAADGGDFYLAQRDRIARWHDGAVSTVAPQTIPAHLLADSNNLYWAETGGPGAPRLVEARRSDGAVTVMATEARSIAALAQDRYRVYWLDAAAGTVSSLLK